MLPFSHLKPGEAKWTFDMTPFGNNTGFIIKDAYYYRQYIKAWYRKYILRKKAIFWMK